MQLRQIVTACIYDTANEIEMLLKFLIFAIATACNYDTANEIEATNEVQRLKIAKIRKSNASEISDICNCDKLWLLAITIQQMRLKLQMKSKD